MIHSAIASNYQPPSSTTSTASIVVGGGGMANGRANGSVSSNNNNNNMAPSPAVVTASQPPTTPSAVSKMDPQTKARERDNLRNIIVQWNANRLDLFEISEPNEVSHSHRHS
jgi:hypothetical protein